MAETSVQRFYRFQSLIYDATRWPVLYGRRRAVTQLALRPDSRVLEIGCGTGLNFARLLRRLDPQRGHLTGVDFSPHMLARARRRVVHSGWPNVELAQADAARLNLPGRFDAILLAYSLAMIPEWREALSQADRHLAPGGHLVVLDFGDFRAWGPVGDAIRAWLRWNHVDTRQPYANEMSALYGDVNVCVGLGGYYFIATAHKPADPPPR